MSAGIQLVADNRYVLAKLQRRTQASGDLPKVAVVLAAFNEETVIEARLQNLLEQDYPQDKLHIYLGSDGSDDQTNELVKTFMQQSNVNNITFHDFTERRGKVSVLNELVEETNEEILVFSDANTNFEPDAISKLVRHFHAPNIGAVCGELELFDAVAGTNRDSLYWRYERLLKFHESRIGGLLGANGAIYAIKQELYQPLSTDTLIDDFAIVMQISDQKKDVIYDPEAIAKEEVAPAIEDEFRRRIRIGAGNYQALARFSHFMSPSYGIRSFTFISHKALRWLVPHCMLIALTSNFLLLGEAPIYNWIFAGQMVFYAIAAYTHVNQNNSIPLSNIIYFFVSMNTALGRGFIKFISGNVKGTWQRTARIDTRNS